MSMGESNTTSFFHILLFLTLFFSPSTQKTLKHSPCKTMVFYFHDILYNGHNIKNATSVIVGAPARTTKTKLSGPNNFGDMVVFNDPITLDAHLHSPSIGRAQGMYFYDNKEIFTAWFAFSFVFNSTEHKGTLNFAGADPTSVKTRDISVIGGTGDFLMARGVATFMTSTFQGGDYFRLRTEVNLYECWS